MIVVRHTKKMILSILFILKLCPGWNLPPFQFISQFASKNGRSRLSMLAPIGMQWKSMKIFSRLTR